MVLDRDEREPTAATWKSLAAMVRRVWRRAYCPYTAQRVGASILTAKGYIFSGCNVENYVAGLASHRARCVVHARCSPDTANTSRLLYTQKESRLSSHAARVSKCSMNSLLDGSPYSQFRTNLPAQCASSIEALEPAKEPTED